MSEKCMKILALKGRIQDLQKAVVGFYEPCVLGKQKKVSFIKSGNTRKLQRLELVHTDVYGPKSVASIEIFNTFKKWKAVVENETNLRVKCLKSDNGGEYSSPEFIEYCTKNEIRMLKTSMRLHAGLPKMFWEDSVTTAAYLINHGPSVPLGFRILKEEWQGKEVSLAHLRVFRYDSYVKDSKSHKVVQSRDVTFNEDSLYGAKAVTDSSNLTKPNQKDQVVLEDSPENLANKSIVTEHGLSSEITQSPGGSSDMNKRSKNSGSFEDSGRSDEEYSEDSASSEEGGSETPQL
ncbi:retrovirus-related pol polyprotein from transposon TNT 1-94 [Tanacetum coccineum]